MKFKVIASIVVLIVLVLSIIIGNAIRNSNDEAAPDMAPVEFTQ